MKTKHSIARWLMLLALSTFTTFYVAQPSTAFAQGTAFSYQGSLQNNGSPASGTYNLQFSLFNVNSGGSAVAGPVTTNGVIVTNGLFTVLIDFSPGAFTGMTCWLEMGVESNGVSSFTTLTPRQQLTPTPYAIFANTTSNLSGTLPAAQLSAGTANIGISGNAATATTANTFTSSLSGDVTGTQGATVVSTVGGQSAANVASGANAANAATSANTASTMVKRDGSGNFSAGIITASLSGNATSATTANNFSGSLAGNVTGTQGATVVSTVGGQTAANVASGVIAANAATSANTASTIVKRDATGSFSATNLTLNGNLNLPATTASAGIIYSGGIPLLHADASLNSCVGLYAGNLTMSGSYNTANGYGAMTFNTNGSYNTANGYEAMTFNASGSYNTANGSQALLRNTTGDFNTAAGAYALEFITNGSFNSANGFQTLNSLTSGSDNTAIGGSALRYNTNCSENTAIGSEALYQSMTGNNNIALGYQAGYDNLTGNNNIFIGNGGYPTDNNIIRIGSGQVATYITGVSGVTISPSGGAVYVNANGQLGTVNSSRRFKEAIQNMGDQSDVLLSLRPVAFRYKPDLDPQGTPQFGLIAEEVEKVAPELVLRDAKGEVSSVRYEQVNAMLLNEFLKEHRKVEQLESRLEKLEQLLNAKNGGRQ